MEKIRNIINKIVESFCIVIMGIMTILVSWQVFTRYALNNPSTFTEKSAQYLFVWLVLYCSAYVFGKREHMSITFLNQKFPNKIKKFINIFIEVIISFFTTGVMIFGGYISSVKQMGQLDASLQVPIGVIYSAIPISGVLVLFYSITNLIRIIKEDKNEKLNTTEISEQSKGVKQWS